MKPAPLRVPDGHEEMRQRVLESFAGLFESQTRTRRFASSITELTRDTHDELLSGLRDSIQRIAGLDIAPDTRSHIVSGLERALARCERLDKTLDVLVDERRRQWRKNASDL